jgi:hypothetical protein
VISGTSLHIKTTGPALKDQLPFCLCSSKFSSSSLPSNFKRCQPHKCSLRQPHLCHYHLKPCQGWRHFRQLRNCYTAHRRFANVSGLLQTCRQFKKKKSTTGPIRNSKGWTLEDIRYLRIIRDSIRLSDAIQNPNTPRWILMNQLELIKSLEWLLSTWPYHHQVLDDQGHLRYRHFGPLLEHLRSQGLLTHLLPCYPELRTQVHLQREPSKCARS